MKHWRSHDGSVELWQGDCRDVLLSLDDGSVDSCVTDPPYGISFMSESWDHAVPGIDYWSEVYRVLKLGGTLLAFGGCRTFHRLACAIEDAGFEVRDCLCWLFGQGFPKGQNISKAIDRKLGAERKIVGHQRLTGNACVSLKEKGGTYGVQVGTISSQEVPITAPASEEAQLWDGWNTNLRPGWQPIILAIKPLDGTFAENAMKHGVAGLNIDGCRLKTGVVTINTWNDGAKPFGGGAGHPYTGRQAEGRWPPNVVLDPEVAKELDRTVGVRSGGQPQPGGSKTTNNCYGSYSERRLVCHPDTGGPSRYFYCPKITTAERTANGEVSNKHPTVKPVALMRWLVRLTATPTGGKVLDPFMGSGSTVLACIAEGRPCIGIELEEESLKVAVERVRSFAVMPDEDSADDEPRSDLKGQQWLF